MTNTESIKQLLSFVLGRERVYEIEAAIGFCAHFVLIISQFIQLPLRFPIEYYATSPVKICDFNLTSTT